MPEGSVALPPALVLAPEGLLCAVNSEGKMLAFKVSDLPEMPKGKGNKIFDIPSKKAADRSEVLKAVAVVPPQGKLVLYSGDKTKTLDWGDLKGVQGQRAQRGSVLMRGWRDIDRIEGIPRLRDIAWRRCSGSTRAARRSSATISYKFARREDRATGRAEHSALTRAGRLFADRGRCRDVASGSAVVGSVAGGNGGDWVCDPACFLG